MPWLSGPETRDLTMVGWGHKHRLAASALRPQAPESQMTEEWGILYPRKVEGDIRQACHHFLRLKFNASGSRKSRNAGVKQERGAWLISMRAERRQMEPEKTWKMFLL